MVKSFLYLHLKTPERRDVGETHSTHDVIRDLRDIPSDRIKFKDPAEPGPDSGTPGDKEPIVAEDPNLKKQDIRITTIGGLAEMLVEAGIVPADESLKAVLDIYVKLGIRQADEMDHFNGGMKSNLRVREYVVDMIDLHNPDAIQADPAADPEPPADDSAAGEGDADPEVGDDTGQPEPASDVDSDDPQPQPAADPEPTPAPSDALLSPDEVVRRKDELMLTLEDSLAAVQRSLRPDKVDAFADQLCRVAYEIYALFGLDQLQIDRRVFSLKPQGSHTREELVADTDLIPAVWYHRASWELARSEDPPAKALVELSLPSFTYELEQLRRKSQPSRLRRARTVPPAPPAPGAGSDDSAGQPVSQDIEPGTDAKEPSGRHVVRSGPPPVPGRKVSSAGTAPAQDADEGTPPAGSAEPDNPTPVPTPADDSSGDARPPSSQDDAGEPHSELYNAAYALFASDPDATFDSVVAELFPSAS